MLRRIIHRVKLFFEQDLKEPRMTQITRIVFDESVKSV
jgi:hypothetical protein